MLIDYSRVVYTRGCIALLISRIRTYNVDQFVRTASGFAMIIECNPNHEVHYPSLSTAFYRTRCCRHPEKDAHHPHLYTRNMPTTLPQAVNKPFCTFCRPNMLGCFSRRPCELFLLRSITSIGSLTENNQGLKTGPRQVRHWGLKGACFSRLVLRFQWSDSIHAGISLAIFSPRFQ